MALVVAVCGIMGWLTSYPRMAPAQVPLFEGAQLDLVTRQALERACQDCHSPNTRRPRYTRLPPAAEMIRHDVESARSQVDFGAWAAKTPAEQLELLTRSLRVASPTAPPARFPALPPQSAPDVPR